MIKKDRKKITLAWYDQGIRFCLYAVIVAVPIVFSPWFYTVFSAPKLLILRLLTSIVFLLWGCKIFVEGAISYRKTYLNWLLLLYGAVSLLTVIFSIAPFSSLYGAEGRFLGIFTILNFLVLPVLILCFLDEKSPKKIAVVSIVTASVISIYGLTQYAGLFTDYFNWSDNPAERVFATVGHANHLGAYLGMNILLAVFLFPYIKKSQRLLLTLGLVLMSVVLVLTASRGSILATLLALFICTAVVAIKKWNEIKLQLGKKSVKIGIVLVALLALISVSIGLFKGLSLTERTSQTISFIEQGNIPDRLSWWMSTLQMIKDRPLLGSGLSTYRDIYNTYRRHDYKVNVPGDMQDYITPEAAHNEYLNIAATQGLIGLAAFLAMILFLLWKVDKVTLFAKKPDKNLYMLMGYKGAMLVYLIQVFVSFGVITTMAMLFMFIGLLDILAEPKAVMKKVGINKYLIIPLTVVVALCCSVGGYFSLQEARAEISYKNAYTAAATQDPKAAIEFYQETVLIKPQEYAYRQAFGDFALKTAGNKTLPPDVQLKLLILAEANYSAAIAINKYHPSTFYNLALTQLMIYNITKNEVYLNMTCHNLRLAVDLAVNNPLYPYQAGKALLGVGTPKMKRDGINFLNQAIIMRPAYRDATVLVQQHLNGAR